MRGTGGEAMYKEDRSIVYAPVSVQKVCAVYDEEQGALIGHNYRLSVEICPECGAKLIHEAGCVRCLCGWSRC